MIGNLHQHLPPSNLSTQSIDGGSGNQVTNTIDNNIINSIIVCAANNISGIAEDLAELNTKTPEIMKIHYDAAVEELEAAFVNNDYSRYNPEALLMELREHPELYGGTASNPIPVINENSLPEQILTQPTELSSLSKAEESTQDIQLVNAELSAVNQRIIRNNDEKGGGCANRATHAILYMNNMMINKSDLDRLANDNLRSITDIVRDDKENPGILLKYMTCEEVSDNYRDNPNKASLYKKLAEDGLLKNGVMIGWPHHNQSVFLRDGIYYEGDGHQNMHTISTFTVSVDNIEDNAISFDYIYSFKPKPEFQSSVIFNSPELTAKDKLDNMLATIKNKALHPRAVMNMIMHNMKDGKLNDIGDSLLAQAIGSDKYLNENGKEYLVKLLGEKLTQPLELNQSMRNTMLNNSKSIVESGLVWKLQPMEIIETLQYYKDTVDSGKFIEILDKAPAINIQSLSLEDKREFIDATRSILPGIKIDIGGEKLPVDLSSKDRFNSALFLAAKKQPEIFTIKSGEQVISPDSWYNLNSEESKSILNSGYVKAKNFISDVDKFNH
ncbi:hypothetical protein [Aeromonas jandaei]|uniref:hypothetical protein n=1 Tax=Aeromonas jandaei TaxID=650 RepID=UPI003BA1F6E5